MEVNVEKFRELKQKVKSDEVSMKLMYILSLENEVSDKVIEFATRLERITDVYIHPTGKVGINGIVNGLHRYKEFKSV
jgi:hypothetical protein